MGATVDVEVGTALVGRDQELVRLRGAFDRVRGGQGATVLVSGDAGVGKTRLVAAFAGVARRSGGRPLIGDCVEFGQDGRPYAPFVSMVRRLVREVGVGRVLEWAGPTRAELSRLVPALLPTGEAGGEEVGPERLHQALVSLVEGCARAGPVVLVVEDVHWADRSTRSFLPELLHALEHVPVLPVLTVRADELTAGSTLARMLAELVRGGGGVRLHVPPLDREGTARQLALLRGGPVEAEVVDRVHARARGNPLFAEELFASGTTSELPASIRDLLLHRVLALPRPARDLLRVVAVAGDACPGWLVVAAHADAGTDADEALRPAVAAHVLVPDAEDGSWRFRHPLLREATLETLLPGERRRLHRAIAEALDAAEGADLETDRAHHWREAGDARRALTASLAAARAARRIGALPDALAHVDHALRLWRQVGDEAPVLAGVQRHEVLAEGAAIALRHGTYAVAGAHLRQALDEVDADRDPATAATYLVLLGDACRLMVDGDGSRDAFERALARAPDDDLVVRAHATSGLARSRMTMDRHDEAIALALEAHRLGQRAGLPLVQAHALLTLGASRGRSGDYPGGLDDLRAGGQIARDHGDDEALLRCYVNLSVLLCESGDPAAVPSLIDEAARALGPLGRRTDGWRCLTLNVAGSLLSLGRYDELDTQLAALGPVDPDGLEHLETAGILAELAMHRGRLDEAAGSIAAACQWAVATREPQLVAPVWAVAVELAGWQSDGRRGVDLAEEAWGHLGPIITQLAVPLAVAAVWAASCWARSARDGAERALALSAGEHWLARAGVAADAASSTPPPITAAMRAAHAELASARGDHDPTTWADVASAWDAIHRPVPAAHARVRQAEALLHVGDTAAAGATLEQVLAVATRIGAGVVEREARDLARRARLPGGTVDQTIGPSRLTEREHEVMLLVATGLTNAEVGERLFISPRTVSTHVSNALGKLGARTRTEAAAMVRDARPA